MADANEISSESEKCRLTFTFDKDNSLSHDRIYEDSPKRTDEAKSCGKESPSCRKSPETLFANISSKQADDSSEGHVRDHAYEELKKTHKGILQIYRCMCR